MKDKIKAYKDILKTAQKYSEIVDSDRITLDTKSLESAIKALEISDRFGIPIKYLSFSNYLHVENSYDDWTGIMFFPETEAYPIGCSDDGQQPKNEWLYIIRFTCGAYVFGDSYPQKTFQAMFNELKAFGPAYCDTTNKALYFKEDVAKNVYENFWPIFNKYKALVAEEIKEKRKQALIDELAKLENQ